MRNHLTRRQFVGGGAGLVAAGLAAPGWLPAAEPEAACTLENEFLRYVIGSDGRNLRFIDRRDGTDYCLHTAPSAFARVKKAGKDYPASAVTFSDGRLSVQFGESGVAAVVRPIVGKRHLVMEVVSCEGEQVEEFIFADVLLTLKGAPEEPFAACAPPEDQIKFTPACFALPSPPNGDSVAADRKLFQAAQWRATPYGTKPCSYPPEGPSTPEFHILVLDALVTHA